MVNRRVLCKAPSIQRAVVRRYIGVSRARGVQVPETRKWQVRAGDPSADQVGLSDPGFRVDSRRRYALSLMIEPGLLAAAWVGA